MTQQKRWKTYAPTYVRMPLANNKPVSYNFTAGWAPGHPAFEKREAFVEVIK